MGGGDHRSGLFAASARVGFGLDPTRQFRTYFKGNRAEGHRRLGTQIAAALAVAAVLLTAGVATFGRRDVPS